MHDNCLSYAIGGRGEEWGGTHRNWTLCNRKIAVRRESPIQRQQIVVKYARGITLNTVNTVTNNFYSLLSKAGAEGSSNSQIENFSSLVDHISQDESEHLYIFLQSIGFICHTKWLTSPPIFIYH